MDVIALLFRYLEKKKCKIEIRPNARSYNQPRLLLRLYIISKECAVNIKSRPTDIAKQ